MIFEALGVCTGSQLGVGAQCPHCLPQKVQLQPEEDPKPRNKKTPEKPYEIIRSSYSNRDF